MIFCVKLLFAFQIIYHVNIAVCSIFGVISCKAYEPGQLGLRSHRNKSGSWLIAQAVHVGSTTNNRGDKSYYWLWHSKQHNTITLKKYK